MPGCFPQRERSTPKSMTVSPRKAKSKSSEAKLGSGIGKGQGMLQSSLKRHFTNQGVSQTTPASHDSDQAAQAPSGGVRGTCEASRSIGGAQGQKASRGATEAPDHPEKKRGKRKRTNDSGSQEEGEAKAEEQKTSAASAINSLSLFGRPPQSSLTPAAPNTPRRKRARYDRSLGLPAPAISPSKRKSLLAESAKDVAMQQHLLWERSSSPLQPIENVVESGRREREAEALNRLKVNLTPSKLRHGYSLLAFDEDDFGSLDSSQLETGYSDERRVEVQESDEDPPSPSAERKDRAGSALGLLTYTRSPRSSKRIYANETQWPLASSPLPGSRHGGLGSEADCETGSEVDASRLPDVLDDSAPLSSPPPSPSRGEKDMASSQTAPGGSFSLSKVKDAVGRDGKGRADVRLESYMSEEVDGEADDWRRGGDETYRLPSSQTFETPQRAGEERRLTLRSNSKTERGARVEGDSRSDDETQSLDWSPVSEAQVPQGRAAEAKPGKRARTSESWADVTRVWSQVELSQGDSEVEGQSARTMHQSSLAGFGFQSKGGCGGKKRNAVAVALSNDVEFHTDEEVESDVGDETQLLEWSDEGEGEGGGMSMSGSRFASSLLLPGEDDMDSQTRLFLEEA